MSKKYKVLLYYKYVNLEDPQEVKKWQKELCDSLNLKGKILVADEGINGTLAGLSADSDEYIKQTMARPKFSDMEWKISYSDTQIFPKMKVKYRPEIVTLGIKRTGKDVNIDNKAHYIEPEELLSLYEEDEDFLILDARNLYEAKIGKFKNAITPPIDCFREFPAFAKTIEDYKDKNIVTYCTGGIRCEKASAYLRENGFKKVRQLHGGIQTYSEKTGGKHFEGEMFIFDDRLHIPVNTVNPTDIAECKHCKKNVSRYIDCSVIGCPSLFICCNECEEEHQATCSDKCLQIILSNPEQSRFSSSASSTEGL
ncbi:MAG: rhodanese-related sulfurtransferase [Candidatus Pacebacteria bacterium]|nr:rhodanese-related sulfurtransferase [Candidatus Paceibacterota bacterium]